MGVLFKSLCIIAILGTVIFYLWKFKKKKYVFSPFNIGIFSVIFATLIMPFVFSNDNQSWNALGISDAKNMIHYLEKSVLINVIGYLIFLLSVFYIELKDSNFKPQINISETIQVNLRVKLLIAFWRISVISWVGIVVVYNHGIPLLNGGRTFYINTPVSPIYLFLNELILIYSLIFGAMFIYKNKCRLKFLVSVFLLIGTGNRGNVLLSCVYPVFVLWLYYSNRKNNCRNVQKITWKIIILCVFICLAGLMMSGVRNGSQTSLTSILDEMIYGNTFSDVRDGAFILKGWEESGLGYLFGKTYGAGLLSFIPSSISAFRLKWAWGRFSTTMLFGWVDHTGLRGGNSMEAYLNFGWFGVIVASMIQGFLTGYIENIFYKRCIKMNEGLSVGEILYILLLQRIQAFFVCTAGNYTLYVFMLFVCSFIVISSMLRNGKIVICKNINGDRN